MNDTGKIAISPGLILLFSLATFFFGVPALAADIDRLCSGSSLSNGQWARYASDAPFMKDKVESRHAIVGEEAGHYWMEFEAAMPVGEGAFVIKILIPGWPYAKGTAKRALMQMPQGPGMDEMPPMEMPPGSVQKDNISDPMRLACEALDKGVREPVKVPAGAFNAIRVPVRQLGKDVWLSSAVPFGIVKMADAGGKGTELVAYGNDAVSAITREPMQVPGAEQQ